MATRHSTTGQRTRDARRAPVVSWRPAIVIAALVVVAIAVVVGPRVWPRPTATPAPAAGPIAATSTGRGSGDELYQTFCASCHGLEGRGDGPAAPLCRVPPADFTRAEFKVRSTANGALPRDQDLQAVIRRGVPTARCRPSRCSSPPRSIGSSLT